MKNLFLISILFLIHLVSVAQNFTDSNLPIVIINTDINTNTGQPFEIVDEPKVLATMKIIFRPDGSRNYLTDQSNTNYLNYNGRIGIELRGSSSQSLPKKPYGLTTYKSDNTTNNNVSILGMPKENDWVLNSIAYDASLVRNFLSYDLARSLGDYAPRCVYCEVIVNGYYQGLYIFMEKIKIDSERVNILKMTTNDNSQPNVSGGFLVKADKTTGGDPIAWSMQSYNGYTDFLYDNPKASDITNQQKNYISVQFANLQTAMNSQNASISNGYPSMIDIPSFIDYMLISELASNSDSYQYSTYFHKERTGKLRAGPIWDFDLTYGNDLFMWGLDRSHTDVWQFDNGDNTGAKFWKDLYDNEIFKCYLTKRWKELIATGGLLNYDVISAKIDQFVSEISEAIPRENNKWGTVSNQANEIINMKSWLLARFVWINSKLTDYQSCSNPILPPLVISKINYNPVVTQGISNNNLEFIEIINNGDLPVDLTGIYFRKLGFTYQFPVNSTLASYGRLYLASNSSSFQQIYNIAPFGQFTRNLSNNSEKLILADAFGNTIDYVEYHDSDPWYSEADSGGYYLQLKDVNLDNNVASNWEVSSNIALGVNDNAVEKMVNIFPNPSQSKITIESELINFESYEMYDLSGRKIIGNTVINSKQFTIDIEKLVPDFYILKLNCRNGETIVQKINKLP